MADELVKVSNNDTTSDFLGEKLVAGDRVRLTELNDGGDEQLEASVEGGLVNLLPWWGNTDLSQSPEGTNAGRNFNWAAEGELIINGSGWKPDPAQINFQSGVPDFIFDDTKENCWWIELTNEETGTGLKFFSWVPVVKGSDDVEMSLIARYQAPPGTNAPSIFVIIADDDANFSLSSGSSLTTDWSTYNMTQNPPTDISVFGNRTVAGFRIVMAPETSAEIQIAEFWCEFV